jgi:hypothetical protein
MSEPVLRVKNWREFQHYTNRRPPWIKLHTALLDDYEFQSLPLASRALAPMIWLLASCTDDGSVPADPVKLAFRFRCDLKELKAGLTPLIDKGFLIPDSSVLADCKQSACSETETETETETYIAAKPRPSKRCPVDWDWKPETLAEIKRECPSIDLGLETRKLRDYEFGRARSDWDAVARNWMREAQSRTKNGKAIPPAPKTPPTPEQITQAQREAAEANRRQLAKALGPGALKGMP